MFSSMSHELKTPLNIVLSALQLLEIQYDNKSVVTVKAYCQGLIQTV
ncbi:hypothetical protein LGK95_21495 [Clostridium algoriphilum]|nr:histidine kinase dimerization/phospho-acceptor domain-containing protein [Clostridium algoriphilum]MCB2296029.1 hypothetical protein [Clostridium algoriphilum]